jgi:hypothetical protein
MHNKTYITQNNFNNHYGYNINQGRIHNSTTTQTTPEIRAEASEALPKRQTAKFDRVITGPAHRLSKSGSQSRWT